MRKERGFTLIEIAIVLVIIGLLIGAILKGQSMIQNAKIKRVKSDIDGIAAAVYSYQDKYGFLPGDDPIDRFSLSCTGDADGIWDWAERICAWRELIAAGFVSGDASLTSETQVAKTSPFGGRYLFRYNGTLGKNYILVDNIPSDAAESLDQRYDDGIYNQGDIQANADYTGGLRDMYWYVF
ncbi:MAG: prepilin-type N-terminal cleavage/methylation domain-containing protein [Candidatus Desulfofervidus auxilii]|nr:prepilin-type N-terminal cleavage/methylation domain-containing protein [Candidatus Desulfofervidus auxilii]